MLFRSLDAKNKTAEENWAILNKLERKITIRRMDAAITLTVGQIAFFACAIFVVYGLVAPWFLTTMIGVKDLAATFPLFAKNILELIPLPWYAAALIIAAGLFIIPWLITLLAKGLTVLVAHLAVKEKTAPLPANEIERAKALTERTRELCGKQYSSNGPDTGLVATYIASITFGLIPLITLLLNDTTRALLEASMVEDLGMEGVIGWIIAVVILAVFLAIPSVAFWFASAVLALGFDIIHAPLYRGKNWYKRYQILLQAGNDFYEQWLAVDADERARHQEWQQQQQAKSEEQAREHDSYISTMASIYAREKKENEEYLKRLHEWATDGDDPTPGCGDGI